jgi:hypothetical protein
VIEAYQISTIVSHPDWPSLPIGARTKTHFNGVGRLQTYIRLTHSAF